MDIKATQLLIACVIGLASCSSGSDDASNATETSTTVAVTTTTVAPAVLALPYFEELAKNTRVGFVAAMDLSAGYATEYAMYLNEYLQAITYAKADGQYLEKLPLQTAQLDDRGRITLESTESRITFSDFVIGYGKLLTFKVEGRDLSRNLKGKAWGEFSCYRRDNASCDSDRSMDLDILHSYITAAGDLAVVYSVRIGSNYGSVREDRTSGGMPNHEVVDSAGNRVKAKAGVETFARGETRVNVVVFGPLAGGGTYTATFRFRGQSLIEFPGFELGDFAG